MLGGKMSNQDEDEVEDELDALAREVNGPVSLPKAPSGAIATDEQLDMPDAPKETPAQRAKRRQQERAAEKGSEPIAA